MAALDDITNFGTDINLVADLAPVWGLSSGQANLANALLRRLITPRGSLFYDLNYGYDVTALLNSALGPADIARARVGIAAELKKDSRVASADVKLVFSAASKTMTITITISTALGPFELVLAASAVTVDLLSFNQLAA